jgi:hypothetical protein
VHALILCRAPFVRHGCGAGSGNNRHGSGSGCDPKRSSSRGGGDVLLGAAGSSPGGERTQGQGQDLGSKRLTLTMCVTSDDDGGMGHTASATVPVPASTLNSAQVSWNVGPQQQQQHHQAPTETPAALIAAYGGGFPEPMDIPGLGRGVSGKPATRWWGPFRQPLHSHPSWLPSYAMIRSAAPLTPRCCSLLRYAGGLHARDRVPVQLGG